MVLQDASCLADVSLTANQTPTASFIHKKSFDLSLDDSSDIDTLHDACYVTINYRRGIFSEIY